MARGVQDAEWDNKRVLYIARVVSWRILSFVRDNAIFESATILIRPRTRGIYNSDENKGDLIGEHVVSCASGAKWLLSQMQFNNS